MISEEDQLLQAVQDPNRQRDHRKARQQDGPDQANGFFGFAKQKEGIGTQDGKGDENAHDDTEHVGISADRRKKLQLSSLALAQIGLVYSVIAREEIFLGRLVVVIDCAGG